MRHLVLIICSLAFIVIPGCSQVQLEKQKAELRQQQAEIQKISAELSATKSELSESKKKIIDWAAKSQAAVQSLAEATERNTRLQTELLEVRNRQQSAVKLLTTEPEASVVDKTADSGTQHGSGTQDGSPQRDDAAKPRNNSEVKMKPAPDSDPKIDSTATSQR